MALPQTGADIQFLVTNTLRQFVGVAEAVARHKKFMDATDLKVAPYSMSADDEGTIKAAVNTLAAGIEAIDMTFVNRDTGLF